MAQYESARKKMGGESKTGAAVETLMAVTPERAPVTTTDDVKPLG